MRDIKYLYLIILDKGKKHPEQQTTTGEYDEIFDFTFDNFFHGWVL